MTRCSPVAGTSWTARLLALAVVACVLEGAVRKWLFPDAPPRTQALFYFSKDAILLLAAASAVRYRARSSPVRRLWTWVVLAGILIGIAGTLTMAGIQPVGAILTVRALIVL